MLIYVVLILTVLIALLFFETYRQRENMKALTQDLEDNVRLLGQELDDGVKMLSQDVCDLKAAGDLGKRELLDEDDKHAVMFILNSMQVGSPRDQDEAPDDEEGKITEVTLDNGNSSEDK